MAEASSPPAPTLPAPNVATNPLSSNSTTTSTAGIEALADATQLLRPSSPLKRNREPEAPVAGVGAMASGGGPQSPISPKSLLTGGSVELTAAAEISEKEAKRRKLGNTAKETSKQISENPSAKAVSALMGEQAISRPEDAPASASDTTKPATEPMAGVAPTAPESAANDQPQTSPVSTNSGAVASGPAESAAPAPVASPGMIAEDDARSQTPKENGRTDRLHVNEPTSAKALTYPGPLSSAQVESSRRNMSVDSGMPRDETKSPASNKKHKCPYCSTEFTRHHNLKSHLLTHSHEKPYLCQDCDSRFRRLHDLKRHMKLHTGERPHVCPICRRSFARGDALARHNKGQGGCAGRRSSAGSFGGEGDDQMEGMIYTTGDASQEPEHMDDENEGPSPRSSNVPSIRHHEAPNPPIRGDTTYQRQPSTYPPVAAGRAPSAPMGSSLYPPSNPHGAPSGPQSPSSQTSPHGSYPPATYGGSGSYPPPMTESPKPLSPGQHAGDARNRSPSLSQGLSANQFARHPTSRDTLPPPPNHSSAPTLPPPPGMSLGPPESRYGGSGSQQAPGGGSYPPPQGGSFPGPGSAGGMSGSASNSLSSHGTGQPGSGDRAGLPYANDERLWAIIRSLESKVERLEGEVGSLRQQLQHHQSYPAPTR